MGYVPSNFLAFYLDANKNLAYERENRTAKKLNIFEKTFENLLTYFCEYGIIIM